MRSELTAYARAARNVPYVRATVFGEILRPLAHEPLNVGLAKAAELVMPDGRQDVRTQRRPVPADRVLTLAGVGAQPPLGQFGELQFPPAGSTANPVSWSSAILVAKSSASFRRWNVSLPNLPLGSRHRTR